MNTEKQPPKHLWIDHMTSYEALVAMLENQREAFNAVKLAIKDM